MTVQNDLNVLLGGGLPVDWSSSRFAIARAFDLIKTMLFSGAMVQVADGTLPQNFVSTAWASGVPDPEDAPFLWVYEGTDIWVGRNDGVIDLSQASSWYKVTSNSPTTTEGDLIYRGVGQDVRLAVGNDGQALTVVDGVPAWTNPGVIQRGVFGSDTASITISDIPADYNSLRLVIKARTTHSGANYDGLLLRFNGDSTSNYQWINSVIVSTGTSAAGASAADTGIKPPSVFTSSTSLANTWGHVVIDIADYTQTGFWRSVTANGTYATSAGTNQQFGGNWKNTADPITSILIAPVSGANFIAGSSYTLYGIK